MKNVLVGDGICKEYCDRKCKTCNRTRTDCVECSEFYVKGESGECVIASQSLSIFIGIRPFLNVVKKRGHRWMFMVIDDLWLYQYHQQEYEGIVRDIFSTIAFIEEKQWEVVGLQKYLEEMKAKMKEIKKYNPHSNKKYMEVSRNNNSLLDNLLDFLVFSVPLMILLEFLNYKLFYCLFDYEVSKYLRPYSFRLILIELLIQGNLEYFTFLGFRALQVFFSYTVASTLM